MAHYEPMEGSFHQDDLLDEEEVIEVDSDDEDTTRFLNQDPPILRLILCPLKSPRRWTPPLPLFPNDEFSRVELPWPL